VELTRFKIQQRAHDHHALLLENVMPTFSLKANIKLPAKARAHPTIFSTKEFQ
jgi:hypothetical protein